MNMRTAEADRLRDPYPMILAVDRGGRPAEWIHWQVAAGHYLLDRVAWHVGVPAVTLHGGINRNGIRSTLDLHPVIAVAGADASRFEDRPVPLTNRTLFARDHHLCMYCGERYPQRLLTRDHVLPRARGGTDTWENVVTACKACNTRKDCRTPEEAGLKLLALPFRPSHVEGLILANRRILADQMAFLEAQRPRRRRPA